MKPVCDSHFLLSANPRTELTSLWKFPELIIRYAMAIFDISALASDVNGTTKPAERNVGAHFTRLVCERS
jgi:hypothetical protein